VEDEQAWYGAVRPIMSAAGLFSIEERRPINEDWDAPLSAD
jgi:hypothetical protein